MVKHFTITHFIEHILFRYLKIIFSCGLLLLFVTLFSQDPVTNNLKKHEFLLSSDTIISEISTISPSSLSVTDQRGNKLKDGDIYRLKNNQLYIYKKNNVDSVKIHYRLLKYDLYHSTPALDSANILLEDRVIPIAADYTKNEFEGRRFIQSSKLEYSGSFSRGLSFGNTQDVVLNSSFNLQMSGDLGNNLIVRAAISDENIPIQPEGNTQVLQEFDKIFIQIQKDKTSVVAGDYEISSPDGYFMKYYKKLKGISVQNESQLGGRWTINNKGSFAVSRGKFKRQNLATREGNQGPYKLEGENGELFLQVLSGTEKVYADGRLLKRGESNDYVIDYNRAEIRFTPKQIIKANLRIIVEFEYAVQSYLRSLFAGSSRIKNDKFAFQFSIYLEQDSKNLSSNIEYDSIDIQALQSSGDNPVLRSGIFMPDFESFDEIIKYRQESDGRLVYSPDDNTNVVAANFTNLGSGNGSYIIDSDAGANGRVYSYQGNNLGNYDPVIRLIPPEKKQLITLSGKYNLGDSTNIFIETGLSNNDLNRFAELGNDDNTGFSIFSEFTDTRKFGTNGKWMLSSLFNIESSESDFRALNPYRNAEFSRDWSFDNSQEVMKQQLYNSQIELSRLNDNFSYRFSGFQNESLYEGLRHSAQYQHRDDQWLITLVGNWMNSETISENISFSRPKVTIEKQLFNKKWKVGSYYEKEKNIRERITSDSLSNLSFNYNLYRIYLQSGENDRFNLRFGYTKRLDDAVIENALVPVTMSNDYEIGGNWMASKASQLSWQLVFRDFSVEIQDSLNSNQYEASRSFIGNIDHKLNLFNNGLSLQTYFESNSGQEPRFEFQYIRVQNGEGTYLWDDQNQDSIQQINEFYIANFSDQANFEKITVFNDEFISTNRSIINQSIKINPKKFLKNQKSVLSRTMIQAKYRIDQKSLSAENDKLLRFINFNFQDSSLVAYNAGTDINLFFNRGNPAYDIQLSYRALDNKITQISGYEQRSKDEIYSRGRFNIIDKIDVIIESSFGDKHRDSEKFEDQNFNISFWEIGPKLNFRPKSNLRIILKYNYENQKDSLSSYQAISHNLGTELTWRQKRNSNLQFRFDFVNINFSGLANSALEFEMLQGLKNGSNALWQINYTRRIANNIDLIINYEGRKSKDVKMVNTAGVQMRAIF